MKSEPRPSRRRRWVAVGSGVVAVYLIVAMAVALTRAPLDSNVFIVTMVVLVGITGALVRWAIKLWR